MEKNRFGTITLMGSGEMAESMSRVHRKVLGLVDGQPAPVFLDTPAGFELNSGEIADRAVDYFAQRFSLPLEVASYRSKEGATAAETAGAIDKLRRSNYIFAGPGSPSYAVRNWLGTAVWDTVVSRWREGAHLVLASAAAITIGRFALPVYEVYKAGFDPHWIPGLDLLGPLGFDLAILPHWNNSEGGTFDTRFCYMGAPRLELLQHELPPTTVILGIDEYTACLLDPSARTGEVLGAGRVTVRQAGREWQFEAGSTFPLERLRAAEPRRGARSDTVQTAEAEAEPVLQTGPTADATRYLHQLAHALREARATDEQRDLIDHAHDTMHELSAEWLGQEHAEEQADIGPFVELLLQLRAELRSARQYALADKIRARLAELGIVIEDTPEGTRWRR